MLLWHNADILLMHWLEVLGAVAASQAQAAGKASRLVEIVAV